MSGIDKIDFDNILKNIYIIFILQVFFRSDNNNLNLGNNDNLLFSNNIEEFSFNNWSEGNSVYNFFGNNNLLDNQNTNFETLVNSFNRKLKNNLESDSNIDKKENLELNYKNEKNEEENKNEKINSANMNDDNLTDKIEIEIENSKNQNNEKIKKRIIFECNNTSCTDKNRIKELEANLVNNNIFGHKFFKEKEINEKVIKDMKFIKKKRYRRTKTEIKLIKEMEKNNPKIELKKGRIKNIDKIENIKNISHSKICTDNIIKKVKCKYFEYSIKTVNVLIEKYKTNENKKYILLKLDYKLYIDQLNKEADLNLLKMSLKIFLSLEISRKYKEHPKDENKNTIARLLNDEKDNVTINYIMNLTFMQWIDMFRNKKEENINGDIVKFEGIDEVIKTIENKNKEEGYLANFIYALYNYENWFNNKVGRKKKGTKDF